MITKLLNLSIFLVGTTLIINGVSAKADDIINSAKIAALEANSYQIRTALDLYYIDHESYPNVSGSSAMIEALKEENYIRENAPLDHNGFDYISKNNGSDYYFKINN